MTTVPQSTSTLSKVNKTAAWKRAKRERHDQNRELRAGLHQRKANTSSINGRALIQVEIDAISKHA